MTPDVIADALAGIRLETDGRIMALGSYENRVYLVHLEDWVQSHHFDTAQVVVKFYRPGRWSQEQILEEHQFALELLQEEIPVVAPEVIQGQTLHNFAGFQFAVYQRMGGRAPELDDPQVLEWLGRFLARIHMVGRRSAFASRPVLDIQSFGHACRDWLLQHDVLPMDVKSNWLASCDEALACIKAVWETVPDLNLLRLHGDCHPGNILWRPEHGNDPGGLHFVDWRELALMEPLRTLRMIHYSTWLAKRWHDPAFPLAFPWFGPASYWQEQVQSLRTQTMLMHEQMNRF